MYRTFHDVQTYMPIILLIRSKEKQLTLCIPVIYIDIYTRIRDVRLLMNVISYIITVIARIKSSSSVKTTVSALWTIPTLDPLWLTAQWQRSWPYFGDLCLYIYMYIISTRHDFRYTVYIQVHKVLYLYHIKLVFGGGGRMISVVFGPVD